MELRRKKREKGKELIRKRKKSGKIWDEKDERMKT